MSHLGKKEQRVVVWETRVGERSKGPSMKKDGKEARKHFLVFSFPFLAALKTHFIFPPFTPKKKQRMFRAFSLFLLLPDPSSNFPLLPLFPFYLFPPVSALDPSSTFWLPPSSLPLSHPAPFLPPLCNLLSLQAAATATTVREQEGEGGRIGFMKTGK